MLDINCSVPGIFQTHFDVALVWMAASLAAFKTFVAGFYDDFRLLGVAVRFCAAFCCFMI